MIELITKNLGAVASRECIGQTSIATELKTNDYERLVRILISLAHLHKSSPATGNITTDSLRRDCEGQLVMILNEQRPSLCENSAKGAAESRFFLNVGANPSFEDDLVALGVVVAELMVPSSKRPALDLRFRETLADRLPNGMKPIARAMKHLVRSLLCCPSSQYSSTAEFVTDVLGILAFAESNNSLVIKRIGWFSLARRRIRFTLALVVIAFTLAMFGISSYRGLQAQLADSRRDALALETKIEGLVDERSSPLQGLKSPPSKSEQPLNLLPNSLAGETVYLAFKDEPILLLDKEFQKCINKNQITVEEDKLLRVTLSACQKAANVWWGCVKQSLDSTSIDKKIAAQDESVQKVLRAWRDKVVTRSEYTLVIAEHSCPKDYEGYQIGITFDNPSGKKRSVHRRFHVKDGKLVPDDAKRPTLDFDVDWKDSEQLTLSVEYWSNWKVHWDNLYEYKTTGELALSKFDGLEVQSKNAYGFDFKFALEPNLGPPTSTRMSLPEIGSAVHLSSGNPKDRIDDPTTTTELNPTREFK